MSGVNRKSLMYIAKHRDPQGIGISRKITQGESQKIDQILPVLDYLIEKKEFYAIGLKHHLDKINHKSIDRTISLLIKIGLIVLDRKEIKNKKIYKISSIKDIKQYRSDLQKYRTFKVFLGATLQPKKLRAIDGFLHFGSNFNRIIEKSQKRSQFVFPLPEDFFEKLLNIRDRTTFTKLSAVSKKWPEPLSIDEMRSSIISKIISDYQYGRICPICFLNNRLRYFTPHEQEFVCDSGHVTDLDLNETNAYSENEILDTDKISKKLTDAQLEYQKKNYLKQTNNPNSRIQDYDLGGI